MIIRLVRASVHVYQLRRFRAPDAHLDRKALDMAWIVRKTLNSGNAVYLVRYRTSDGSARAAERNPDASRPGANAYDCGFGPP